MIEKLKGHKKLCIYHKNGTYQVNMTLKSIMQTLESNELVRCHNAFVVNFKAIEKIDKKTNTVFLKQNLQCTYSYMMGKKLFERIKELLK